MLGSGQQIHNIETLLLELVKDIIDEMHKNSINKMQAENLTIPPPLSVIRNAFAIKKNEMMDYFESIFNKEISGISNTYESQFKKNAELFSIFYKK